MTDAPRPIEHRIDGPLEVAFAEGRALEVERISLTGEPAARLKPRRWQLELVIDGGRRQELLALHEAGVSPLAAPHLLRFDIRRPIAICFEPAAWLAARLDVLEDEKELMSGASLDERVATDALDLRNYEFSSATQGS